MPTKSSAIHHQHIRKRIHKKYEAYPHPQKLKRIFDHLIYAAVIIGPILNLPQLFKIYLEQDATGVSYVSWFGFTTLSIVWFIYGVLHKDKPILFMNLSLIVVQSLIAIGAVIYG